VKILAIETSCDETAAAVVEDGRNVLSSVVSSQVDLHARFGGVVPEVASRAHLELLTPVVDQALLEAGTDGSGLGAVAATIGPGLIGSLLVGVRAAKAYSLVWRVPFVGINHMEAHLHAAFLEDPELSVPMIVLLVSGGHTLMIEMDRSVETRPGRAGNGFPFVYRLLGETIDDAAGEAFDKVARYLGLGYPGGPAIDRIARRGDRTAVAFPRAMRDEGFDFSFSGLKTSVISYVRKHPEVSVADVAASFQEAIVDVLAVKCLAALEREGLDRLVVAGGVGANSRLRARLTVGANDRGAKVFFPPLRLCTDNGAMIAFAAALKFPEGHASSDSFPVFPRWDLASAAASA